MSAAGSGGTAPMQNNPLTQMNPVAGNVPLTQRPMLFQQAPMLLKSANPVVGMSAGPDALNMDLPSLGQISQPPAQPGMPAQQNGMLGLGGGGGQSQGALAGQNAVAAMQAAQQGRVFAPGVSGGANLPKSGGGSSGASTAQTMQTVMNLAKLIGI